VTFLTTINGLFRPNVALSILLLFCFTQVAPAQDSATLRDQLRRNQKKIAAVKVQLKEANRREKEITDKLSQTKNRKDKAEDELAKVQAELDVAEEKLRKLKMRIRRTSIRLLRTQRALEGRLREIYMEGEVSYLALLLQSDDFTDFLNQADYLKLIVKSDSQLIGSVKKHKSDLDVQRKAARDTVIELTKLKATKKDRVDALARLKAAQEDLYARLRAHQKKLNSRVDALEEISAKKEAELRAFIQRQSLPGYVPIPRSAGAYIYPVNGPITSNYGYRVHPIRGTTRLHTGLDFGVGYGVPILAADNGVVIHSGWYGGYGNTVIVDHGGGFTTLYAHASSLSVSHGQTVKQGQTVSRVGSTGMSTGPHLHFEVRYHGNPINPLSRL
jgi:murein DD-endopeptidase MepM/ murein hydrolase activator NlpD